MNKCDSCDWYRPKTFFCEYYLKSVEQVFLLCPHCRSENEELTDSEVTDEEDFPEGFFEKPRRHATEEKGFDEKTCIPVTIHYAEPVKRGKWIKADSKQYFRKHYPAFTCSECGQRKDSQKTWNYCPNCGARMDEE